MIIIDFNKKAIVQDDLNPDKLELLGLLLRISTRVLAKHSGYELRQPELSPKEKTQLDALNGISRLFVTLMDLSDENGVDYCDGFKHFVRKYFETECQDFIACSTVPINNDGLHGAPPRADPVLRKALGVLQNEIDRTK